MTVVPVVVAVALLCSGCARSEGRELERRLFGRS